ncbi:MAG: cupin-like domain-containing protein [Pseudomonadota bacterium]
MTVLTDHGAIDRAAFEGDIVGGDQPALMRGLVADWPLVAAADDPESFTRAVVAGDAAHPVQAFVAAPQVGGRYFYNDDFTGFNFERRQMALGALFERVYALRDNDNPEGIYAGAIPLTGPMARVADALPMPLLDGIDDRLVSLWFGNRGQTAIHWDLPQNIACVVAGKRRFTLFPPDQLENLYMGPVDVTLAGQPVSLVDPLSPDLERFPRYAEAERHKIVVTLEPGDALYLPSLWFHHVESLAPVGALVNYWWRDAAAHMVTPLFTLLHAMLTLKDLPETELANWRRLFDHYVFERDGDTLAHLPEPARGFLGETTPERAQRLRAFLAHSLGVRPR